MTIISILKETQRECLVYGDWLTRTLPDAENFFAMLHNHAMSAQEILDNIGHLRVKTEKERNQRIMLVLRSAWVFSLSVVEYSMKKLIRESKEGPLVKWYHNLKDSPYVAGAKRGFSLRSVIECSHELGIVSDDHHKSWISLQDMRNAIIHNNGYVEEDRRFTIGSVTKHIQTGEKVRYSHLDGAYFVRLIPTMSKDWLENYLNDHNV